jgi:hypothetical protein
VAVGLERFEFVAHVFVAASGPHATDGWTWLGQLWTALGPAFGIAQRIAPFAADLPSKAPAADGVVAARTAPGPGTHQAVVRRTGDVVCVSVLRAPTPGAPRWDTFDAEWSAMSPTPTAGVLGTARVLQAQQADPVEPVDICALAPVVDGLLTVPGGWSGRGALRTEGPFAVWEAADPPAAEGRADRRIVVVAGHGGDGRLSAWTWALGEELSPLARYLLHAAKIRFQLRLWDADGAAGRAALRRRTDEAIAPLLTLADDVVAGRHPRPEALLDATVPLVGLQAGETGLVDRASRLRDLRRVVQIAASNMAKHARDDQAGGLFADDAALADWLQRQLEHDATFLDSAAERARAVAALGEQLVTRSLAARQERVNLGLTGVLGAVVTVLAAIQAFGYQVPLPEPAKSAVIPPVIAVLGALTLALSTVVLRAASGRRRASATALSGALGVLAAAVVWLGIAVLCVLLDLPLPAPGTVTLLAVGGALVAAALAAVLLRRPLAT